MLTVNVQTQKDGGVIEERTLEATEVRRVTEFFRYRDGSEPDEGPGVHVVVGTGDIPFFSKRGLPDGVRYEFFVMNETGQTVARYLV